ncbi:TadE/TadG family type IV pilus assembly protein [Loktanella agnita]|uniref:TadE/TadG family type IV pilus assembly protein n=1 Tax=Loktanella agnita TaxID=287097 RepID=UPI0039887339
MANLSNVRRWRQNEDGVVTIEFLLWLPVMVALLTLTTDATLLMHEQQNMYNAARDSSRQVALGLKTEDEAEELFLTRFDSGDIEVHIVKANGFVTTTASMPFSQTARLSGFLSSGQLSAEVAMWVESDGQDDG